MFILILALHIFILPATYAQSSVDCQPRAEQTRKLIESCLGKPIKVVKIKDDRRLTFDVAWYSSQRQDQFKYYRVAYDPSKKGISCDAGLEMQIDIPSKENYICYPGTGKDGKDITP